VTVAAAVSIAAAVAAVLGAAAALAALKRAHSRLHTLDDEIERGKARFDEVVAREAEARATELEEALALARSRAISVLADEERRITEERRRDVSERERDATAKLGAALTAAQRAVEQRFADWGNDLTTLQQSLSSELERIGQRQRQLVATIDEKVAAEAERLEIALEEHRARLAKSHDDLDRAVQEAAAAVTADLENQAAERRRALHEVAERLRRRERELAEQIEREQTEAAQRVATQLQDVERRHVEQVRRVVSREAQHATEAASTQFDATIRTAREDAARRLARELDLAVERFAREAETVLAERVESELRTFESRFQEIARRIESLSSHP
jgi:hypothetical protein